MRRWVFLRGWAREARHWGAFPGHFGAFHPDADVTALDLPGAGLRRDERAPASVPQLVEACRDRLDVRGGPVLLLGLSLGGMVCAEWASRYPGEVAGAVLINTSMQPFNPVVQRLRPRNYAAIARILLEREPARREASVLRLTSFDPAAHDGIVEAWAGYARERPVTRANALRQLWAAARYRAPLEAPAVPLLVLTTAGDQLVDPACSRALASAWNAPIAVHPTAGHDLTLDDGPWVAAQVRRWLGETRAPA